MSVSSRETQTGGRAGAAGAAGGHAKTAPDAVGTPGHRPPVVLTLGKFDGVHAGHRQLLSHVIEEAGRRSVESVALVLHPDPASVVSDRNVGLLTTIRDRCARIRAFGVDLAEPLHFTPGVASLSPEAFIDRVTGRFALMAIVIGPDFAFGQGRRGNVDTLRRLGLQRGFDVIVAPPLVYGGRQVGSRHVRTMVTAGEIDAARTLLRAPPRLVGMVVHGAARGRSLGFPTANLDPVDDFVIPANGIYSVRVRWQRGSPDEGGGVAEGLASIGVRPTFDNGPRVIEIFLIDFSGDLYGSEMTVDFIARQRDELTFSGPEALVDQMNLDVALGRSILAAEAAPAWRLDEAASGIELHVRGWDLAELCQNAMAGVYSALDHELPASTLAARRLGLTADGDGALMSQWLQAATGQPEGAGGRYAASSVFQAGHGTLHALLWSDPAPASRRAPPTVRLAAAPHYGPDGWLEATVICDT